jgi:putative MATE family efflux protein
VSGFLGRLQRIRHQAPDGSQPLLDGPIVSTLLGLSIPMIMAMFLVTGFGLVDMLYLGRYSPVAMAAISVAFPATYLLQTLATALGTAATSLSSRLLGAGQERQARNLLLHVLLADAGLTVIALPAGLLALRPLIGAMGAPAEVTAEAVAYGRIIYLGALPALLPMSMNALFRSEGDTIFPFKVMALALALNAVLNPLLIFGPGPLPRLGVQGAALTTVASFCVATLFVLRELRNPSRRIRLERRAWRFAPELLRGLANVGVPALAATSAAPLAVFIVNSLLAPYGTPALAAYGVGMRLLSFVFLPTLGISMSMLVMVGQNHGAGRRDRVVRITRAALLFAMGLLSLLAVPVILFPRIALGIFTSEPAVIAAGIPLVFWVMMARPMLSVANVSGLWFQALGRGVTGSVPNVFMRVIMEPLGLWLGLRLGGLEAGWQGMAAGGAAGGLLLLLFLIWRLRVYRTRVPFAPTGAR